MSSIFFIVLLISLIFTLLLEIIKRRFKLRALYTRKIAHFFFFIVILITHSLINTKECLLILSIFLIIFIISYILYLLSSIHIKEYITYGELIYIICFMVLFIFWGDNYYIFTSSAFVLGLLDPISSFIKKESKKEVRYNLIYLIMCFAILSLIAFYFKEFNIIKIVIASIVAAVVDRFSEHGLDNITTPIVVALLLS